MKPPLFCSCRQCISTVHDNRSASQWSLQITKNLSTCQPVCKQPTLSSLPTTEHSTVQPCIVSFFLLIFSSCLPPKNTTSLPRVATLYMVFAWSALLTTAFDFQGWKSLTDFQGWYLWFRYSSWGNSALPCLPLCLPNLQGCQLT